MIKRVLTHETESARPATPPVAHEADGPDRGFFKRKAQRIKALGIVQIGPSGPPEPEAAPEAGLAFAASYLTEHREMIASELAAIDAYAKQVDARIERMRKMGGQDREGIESERAKLKLVRAEIEKDVHTYPLARTPEQRKLITIRARELREQYWRSAERAARAGDFRHATSCRIDSLRARQIAERECGVRGRISGY